MSGAPGRVVLVGEPLVGFVGPPGESLIGAREFRRVIGGAEANVAVGLCRLGQRATLIGRIGEDALGTAVLRHLRGEGVDCRLHRDPAPTAVMIRDRSAAPEVCYHRRDGAGSRLAPADVDEATIAAADRLHLTGITPALSPSAQAAWRRAAELAAAHAIPISLDPNLRRRLWDERAFRAAVLGVLPMVDCLLPGRDELAVLTGIDEPELAARHLLDAHPGLRVVVVKLGAIGALVVEREAAITVAGTAVAEVDAVGAGDAFAAAFLAARLAGRDVRAAAALACRAGAHAARTFGDSESMPEAVSLGDGEIRR